MKCWVIAPWNQFRYSPLHRKLIGGNNIVNFPACFISNDIVFYPENWGGDKICQGSRLAGMQIEKRSAFLDESKFLCWLNFSSLVLQKNHVKNKIKTYSYLNCSVKYHLRPGCFLPLWMEVLGEVCDWEVKKASFSLKDFSNVWLVGTTDVLMPHKSENLQKGHKGWVRLIHKKRSDLPTKTETAGKEDPKQDDEA